MSYELFFYNSLNDEDEVNSELTIFFEACQAAYEASKPKIQRNSAERDRYGAHNRLVAAYFSEHPQYEKATFPVPDALHGYLQMGATTARKSLQIFCKAIMELHGSTDCRNWSWENYPVAFKAQFSRDDHGPYPFILLEAIASNDLWIWHAFFGVSGMNNDVNVLRQSSLFNDLKSGKAPVSIRG
ncbi:ALP1-like protein [Tanacetum coccineum]